MDRLLLASFLLAACTPERAIPAHRYCDQDMAQDVCGWCNEAWCYPEGGGWIGCTEKACGPRPDGGAR
jgi:hypothetical protein